MVGCWLRGSDRSIHTSQQVASHLLHQLTSILKMVDKKLGFWRNETFETPNHVTWQSPATVCRLLPCAFHMVFIRMPPKKLEEVLGFLSKEFIGFLPIRTWNPSKSQEDFWNATLHTFRRYGAETCPRDLTVAMEQVLKKGQTEEGRDDPRYQWLLRFFNDSQW